MIKKLRRDYGTEKRLRRKNEYSITKYISRMNEERN
jgi:hypothetical protein